MPDKLKLQWRVHPALTGLYRTFHKRGWPTATVGDDVTAVRLYCDDEYVPHSVRTGDHGPIAICVADYRDRKPHEAAFTWRTLKKRAATLDEAKTLAAKFMADYPEILGCPD